MNLTDATLGLNSRLVAMLYDDEGGNYLLMQLAGSRFVPIKPLSRAEALTFRCARDQILLHVYPRPFGRSYQRNIAHQQRRRSGQE